MNNRLRFKFHGENWKVSKDVDDCKYQLESIEN